MRNRRKKGINYYILLGLLLVLVVVAVFRRNEILNAFNEDAQLYLLGEKTIDETMDDFAKQKDEIKSKNSN